MPSTTDFRPTLLTALTMPLLLISSAWAEPLERIVVAPDQKGFVRQPSGKAFVPWGFNYDHDRTGRLIEDYWDDDWRDVEQDFEEMRDLGANLVRVHLQFGKFMQAADQPRDAALDRLQRLLELAERVGLYLDLTGLGCYHRNDVPDWYDALSEADRWQSQACFWRAIAGRCREHTAVFCYDLMNEPVVPGGRRAAGDWLGPPFAGKHFVQFITLDQADRPRPEIAREWLRQLVAAVREQDPKRLISVGLVDWSLPGGRLTSGFEPQAVAAEVDFICVHIYPERMKLDEALEALRGFSVGKPIVIEETFPLKCSGDEFAEFVRDSRAVAAGWVGFYWGQTPAECRASGKLADALMLAWLEYFQRQSPQTDEAIRPTPGSRQRQ